MQEILFVEFLTFHSLSWDKPRMNSQKPLSVSANSRYDLHTDVKHKHQDERRSKKKPDRIGKPGDERQNSKHEDYSNHPRLMRKYRARVPIRLFLMIIHTVSISYDISRCLGKHIRHRGRTVARRTSHVTRPHVSRRMLHVAPCESCYGARVPSYVNLTLPFSPFRGERIGQSHGHPGDCQQHFSLR